jgi:hypothetical protein
MPVIPKTIRFVVTVPANAPANSLLVGSNAQVIFDDLIGPVNEFVVPIHSYLLIKDIYIKSTTDVPVDVKIQIIKDGVKLLYETAPVSTLLISNPSRPPLRLPILFRGGQRLSIRAINIAPGQATAQTVTVYADIDFYVP